MRHFHSILCGVAVVLATGCAGTGAKTETADPVFYPGPPEAPRLQWLASYSSSNDLQKASRFKRLVAGDEAERWVARAHGVAWYEGRIYVCDPAMSAVTVFDLKTKKVRPLDAKKERRVRKPLEIAVAPDGWKYITCSADRKVYAYDAQDKCQAVWGDKEKWRPVGVAANDKHLFVTDVANHSIHVLDRKTGDEVRVIGKGGSKAGEFYYPVALSFGPTGDLYVTDSFNCRVQRLKADGTYVTSVGQAGKRLGDFGRPKGLSVDNEGRIYCVDASFANCQIFDDKGRLLLFFGEPGKERGSISLPADVSVSYDAVPYFRDKVAKGYDIDYVVFITSHTGLYKINAYGLLRKK